jgi:hypothetical protein
MGAVKFELQHLEAEFAVVRAYSPNSNGSKIEVAALGIKIYSQSRAEQHQPPHALLSAEFVELIASFLDLPLIQITP